MLVLYRFLFVQHVEEKVKLFQSTAGNVLEKDVYVLERISKLKSHQVWVKVVLFV